MRNQVLPPKTEEKTIAIARRQSIRGENAHLPHLPVSIHDVRFEKDFLLIDEHDISIRTRYIRSAANIWADRLIRETDYADSQLATRIFRYYDKIWGPHSLDRSASFANKLLPCYNAKVER